jgi:hypothetical protein
LLIKYHSKRRGFFIVQGSIIHSLIYYCRRAVQNFIFFQFDHQTFFFCWLNPNWRPIDFDLLWKDRIERRGTKVKRASNTGEMPWVSQKIYTLLLPQYFSNSILVKKLFFFVFLVWETGEKSRWISVIKRKKNIIVTDLDHKNEWYLCQMVQFEEESLC